FVQEEAVGQARSQLNLREDELAKAEKAMFAAKDQAGLAKARHAVDVGRKAVAAARANMTAVEARIAADLARHARPPRPDSDALARAAAKAQRLAEKYAAEEAVLRAELALADAEQAAEDKKAKPDEKARKALSDAKSKRDQARADLKAKNQAVAKDNTNYPPL